MVQCLIFAVTGNSVLENIFCGFCSLAIVIEVMLLSYPLLSVIFILSFPSFQDPYRSGTDCPDK